MIRLMIKQHNITKLKYLCVTTKDDYINYSGSGIYWKRHLDVHGYNFNTVLLLESEENDLEFKSKCLAISMELNVVESDEFANLIHEDGNTWAYGYRFTDDVKERQKKGIREFWESEKGIEYKNILSERMKDLWNGEQGKERKIKQYELYQSHWTDERRKDASERQKKKWEEYKQTGKADEYIAKFNETKRKQTPERKAEIAQKRRESVLKNENHKAHIDRMKTERVGSNNPASRAFMFNGIEFSTSREFRKYTKSIGLSNEEVEQMLDDESNKNCVRLFDVSKKDVIICEHCGASNGNSYKLSAFKRWHNDNCKFKGNRNA